MKTRILRALCLAAALAAGAVGPATAAPAGDGEVRALVEAYYKAVEAEDLDVVADLYHVESDESLEGLLGTHLLVFKATDVKVSELRIREVQLDRTGSGGVAFVTVRSRIASADKTDAYDDESQLAVVVRRVGSQWKIQSVLREAELLMRRRFILCDRAARALESGAGPAGAAREPAQPPGSQPAKPALPAVPGTATNAPPVAAPKPPPAVPAAGNKVSLQAVGFANSCITATILPGGLKSGAVLQAELRRAGSADALRVVPVVVAGDDAQRLSFRPPVGGWEDGSYTVRLLADGKTLCEKTLILKGGSEQK